MVEKFSESEDRTKDSCKDLIEDTRKLVLQKMNFENWPKQSITNP